MTELLPEELEYLTDESRCLGCGHLEYQLHRDGGECEIPGCDCDGPWDYDFYDHPKRRPPLQLKPLGKAIFQQAAKQQSATHQTVVAYEKAWRLFSSIMDDHLCWGCNHPKDDHRFGCDDCKLCDCLGTSSYETYDHPRQEQPPNLSRIGEAVFYQAYENMRVAEGWPETVDVEIYG